MMSYRFMRILVFFDLPTQTLEDKRNYRKFRKTLLTNGFYMMQESVYCRMVHNQSVERNAIAAIKRNRPPAGLVQVLSVTEKQFAKMEYITGVYKREVLDTDERLIIL